MNCEIYRPLLSELIDGELDPGLKKEVENHLEGCRECNDWLKQLESLNKMYAKTTAPETLKHKVIRQIKVENKAGFFKRLNNYLDSNKLASIASLAVTVIVVFSMMVLANSGNRLSIKEASAKPLPVVGSLQNLKKLLGVKDAQVLKTLPHSGYVDNATVDDLATYEVGVTDPNGGYDSGGNEGFWGLDSPSKDFPHTSPDESQNLLDIGSDGRGKLLSSRPNRDLNESVKSKYSKTNVQVEGVDEADVIKTDGQYIYQINKQRIVIAEVFPPNDMKIVGNVRFKGSNFNPTELYIDGDYLVAIGNTQRTITNPSKKVVKPKPGEPQPEPMIYPAEETRETVKAIVYDIADKSDIKKLREIELDGQSVSSRKIGRSVYIVSNKNLDTYRIMQSKNPEINNVTPAYRDSAGKDGYTNVDYSQIKYFSKENVEPNYLMVAGFNIDEENKEAKVSTYLGSGQNIYASQDNLYVAMRDNELVQERRARGLSKSTPAEPNSPVSSTPLEKTGIYKFALLDGSTEYKGKGTVPGAILNQFSMDEFGGYFRIATTADVPSLAINRTNNLYVLDDKLKTVGKLENFAPGENIYSARFMGDRAYIVTFVQTDPLFVIDLKSPLSPRILGELKIPGFSNYLHPYDENHIIGFGKDTKVEGGAVYQQGMKIALFDVTDVSNPKEKFKTIIGDRGTDSELLRNHKALLFDKERGLLAFPVFVNEEKPEPKQSKANPFVPSVEESPIFVESEFKFQGAYIYNLNLDDGFRLKGKITHLSKEDIAKGLYYDGNDKFVERILYIDDFLYTSSKAMIKANDLNNLNEENSLSLSDK